MALKDGFKENFSTLQRAFNNGSVCLVECIDKKTKRGVPVICAVEMHGDEYVLRPFAKLFTCNPYEEVDPPTE